MTYYLYKKTHIKTGLKYLGKTKRNPYEYAGSGKYWTNHINKHGNEVHTEILLETEDHSEITKIGLYYSKLWNVVESEEWANLKVEQGDGGWDHINSKLSKDEYSRRGRLGRIAQDAYFIKKYGSLEKGRQSIINREKANETFKKNYWSNTERQEKNRQQLKEAGERAKLPSSRQKKLETFKRIKHSQGAKNSQYGTCWITKDGINKKIKKVDLDHYIKQGYIKGRVV